MKTILKMLVLGAIGLALYGSLLFAAAGTIHYWQAWALLAVVGILGSIPSIYLLRENPAVLERRMPAAETRMVQKIVAGGVFLLWVSVFVVSALDYRFGWSVVPPAISVVGLILIAAAVGVLWLVLIQNSHAAATVRVETDQKLVSTGLYGLVRHPMYTCNLILLVGVPLALGSYWGLVFIIPGLLVLTLRIRDEEKLLQQELDGYDEYMRQVRYRLVPHVW